MDNGNDRPEETCLIDNTDSAITDRRNGNESTTTTDTNSDSLIAQSSDTPPDTTTNSSPNTRTCSPSRAISLNVNVNNVNGMIKKNTLKATLSLDPAALCRGTIPYEKIARTQLRSSTSGSMELRKVTWLPLYIRRPASVDDHGPWPKVFNWLVNLIELISLTDYKKQFIQIT